MLNPISLLVLSLFFKRFYLFIVKERGGEGKKEGEKHRYVNVCKRYIDSLPLTRPKLRIWPATQPWALSGNPAVTVWIASRCSLCWSAPARAHVKFFISLQGFGGFSGNKVAGLIPGQGTCRTQAMALTGRPPASQRVASSIPSQSTCLGLRQEIVRRKLQRCSRAKIKDIDTGQRPVLRPVVPAFWKTAESWWIITAPVQKMLHDPCFIIIAS